MKTKEWLLNEIKSLDISIASTRRQLKEFDKEWNHPKTNQSRKDFIKGYKEWCNTYIHKYATRKNQHIQRLERIKIGTKNDIC